MKDTYNDIELENLINSWTITPVSKGFATSYEKLYDTYQTKIVAKAFHIPNQETGELHHFNLSLRIFKRKKKSDEWSEYSIDDENDYGTFKQFDIKSGNGLAVKNLTNFLVAQSKMIGEKLDTDKVIIDKPKDLDINELLKQMNFLQKEKFGFGVRIDTLKEYKKFLENNLDKNETFIQNWLDAENGTLRKQRCLIFGLEFIDHKREGEIAKKRFDILTRTSNTINEYIIFELKSPCDDILILKLLQMKTVVKVQNIISQNKLPEPFHKY